MYKLLISSLVAVTLVGAGCRNRNFDITFSGANQSIASSTSTTTAKPSMSVEDYIRSHIMSLSPEKAVLGGKLFVTNINAKDGTGTVTYEDGHNSFSADFTYSTDAQGNIIISQFTNHKEPVTPVEDKPTGPVACTMEYNPVCGLVPVVCVKAPCNPVPQTFGNACAARVAKATNITPGECAGDKQSASTR